MDSARYETFLVDLRQRLESDARVQGLILLGSTADATIRDDLSDHDFWVITTTAALSDYLGSPSWLPDADHVLVIIRHGPHRRTVLYDNRHKVEYAVFDVSSARSGKIERFRVALDRGGIAQLAEEIRDDSIDQGDARLSGGTLSVENFYVVAWSGHERVLRGELLSAHRYVQAAADILLHLFATAEVLPTDRSTDRLDGRRRLEQRAPQAAAALNEILRLPPRDAMARLVALAERSLPKAVLDSASPRIDPIRQWLQNA